MKAIHIDPTEIRVGDMVTGLPRWSEIHGDYAWSMATVASYDWKYAEEGVIVVIEDAAGETWRLSEGDAVRVLRSEDLYPLRDSDGNLVPLDYGA